MTQAASSKAPPSPAARICYKFTCGQWHPSAMEFYARLSRCAREIA